MWMVASEPGFSGRISSAFNWGAISPALSFLFSRKWFFFFQYLELTNLVSLTVYQAPDILLSFSTPQHKGIDYKCHSRVFVLFCVLCFVVVFVLCVCFFTSYVPWLLKLDPCVLWQTLYELSHISRPWWQIDIQKVNFTCGFIHSMPVSVHPQIYHVV